MANEKKSVATPVKPSLIKDGFFGWNNIKWLIIEMRDIYSNRESYFSKKRIESGIAFVIAQWGMIYFLLQKHASLTMGEFMLWASVEFAVSGYIISKIQQEKKDTTTTDTPVDTPPNP